MNTARFAALPLLAIVMVLGVGMPAKAQNIPPGHSPITPDLLEKMQGRWVAVSGDNNTEIEVRGTDVSFVKIDNPRRSAYTPVSGEHFFTIQSSTLSTMLQSRVPGGTPRESRQLAGQCLTRDEANWRGSPDFGCFGHFFPMGHQGPAGYKWVEYWELQVADPSGTGSYIRPEVKAFLLNGGQKPDSVDA